MPYITNLVTKVSPNTKATDTENKIPGTKGFLLPLPSSIW